MMFMNFCFCYDIDLFSMLRFFCFFFSWKRRCIGFFENTVVYSCMQSTIVNLGRRLPSLWLKWYFWYHPNPSTPLPTQKLRKLNNIPEPIFSLKLINCLLILSLRGMYYNSGKCCEIASVIVLFTFTVLIFSCQFRTLYHEAGRFCGTKKCIIIRYYKYYDS